MRYLTNAILPLAVGLALVGAPESAEGKCSRSGGIPVLPEVLYLVDDRVTGQEALDTLDRDDVLSIRIACRDVKSPDGGGPARQTAVEVMTRSGAPAMTETQLRDLVEAQEAHHASRGSYAETLADLEFLTTRTQLGIRMDVSETGWAAHVSSAALGLECHVAAGSADVQFPDQEKGVPSCRAIVEVPTG